jgi:hypothetical protein
MVTKEGPCKYYEEEINAVNNKATQTKEAPKTFNEEDPYHFLQEHPLPGAVFRPDEGFTTTRGHYISGWHRRDFNKYRENYRRAGMTDKPEHDPPKRLSKVPSGPVSTPNA